MKITKRRVRNHHQDGGVKYGEIAKIMGELGFKMKNSTVRNHLVRGLEKIVNETVVRLGVERTVDVRAVVNDRSFQKALAEMLDKITCREDDTRK